MESLGRLPWCWIFRWDSLLKGSSWRVACDKLEFGRWLRALEEMGEMRPDFKKSMSCQVKFYVFLYVDGHLLFLHVFLLLGRNNSSHERQFSHPRVLGVFRWGTEREKAKSHDSYCNDDEALMEQMDSTDSSHRREPLFVRTTQLTWRNFQALEQPFYFLSPFFSLEQRRKKTSFL